MAKEFDALRFQSLIGILQTNFIAAHGKDAYEFQSLIGILQTSA